jgi:hypothetical protein
VIDLRYIVTEGTNFVRIFRLPKEYPSGYCFGGGYPVRIQLIDWFNMFDNQDFWKQEEKQIETSSADYQKYINDMREALQKKIYFNADFDYLAITDYGDAFIINPERRAKILNEKMAELKHAARNKMNGQAGGSCHP